MLPALLLAAACTVPPVFPLRDDPRSLGAGIEALRETGGELSLAEVTRPPACGQFADLPGSANFGIATGSVWLRFHPQLPGAPEQWRLVVRFAGLDQVCVHWPVKFSAEATASECLARGEAAQRARWRQGRLAFAVPPDLDPGRPVYVQARSRLWLEVPLEFTTAENLAAREARRELHWGLYYGVLTMIVLLGLGFYVAQRDRVFLYFALATAAVTGAIAAWQGRFAAWEPPAFSLTWLGPPLVSLAVALWARFAQQFFATRRHAPYAHRALELSFWAALAAAALMGPLLGFAVQAFAPLLLLFLAALVWTAAVRARQGAREALWALAAASVLMLLGVWLALAVTGVLQIATATILPWAAAGNLLNTSILLAGLGWRVRVLRSQRDRARELAAANQKLALYRAHFDETTGLPNRTKLKQDLQELILAAQPAQPRLGLLTLGLERFRAIQQALGSEGGEAVLNEVSQRLRQALRPGEVLARIGPDAFGLIAPLGAGSGMAQLEERAEALRQALSPPLLGGRGLSLSPCLGAALYPEHGAGASLLLRASESALNQARERGGGALRVFEQMLQKHAERHLELGRDLRRALDQDALELHYQPLCSLADGRLLAVEALLRWRRDGRYLPPDQFLPVAEAGELIAPLTDWVFRRACRQLRDWTARSLAVPTVYINVSATQFRLPQFSQRVKAALAEAGLPGAAVVLEITESLLLDDLAATRAVLAELRQHDIVATVDDFGVGYSSLSYLRSLPVGGLKIDHSFLNGIPHEPEAVAVISAILALGRDLRLTVIAEGIETQPQYDFLVQQGVAVGQGYLLARPMPAEALAVWLTDRRPQQAAA